MSKKSRRNENLQMGKPERAHDGYLPSVAPVTERNPASLTGAGVEIENRYGMEPYTEPGRGDSMIKPNH